MSIKFLCFLGCASS